MSRIIALFMFYAALAGCGKPQEVKLTYRNGAVAVTGINATTLGGLRRDSMTTEAWQTLLPVRQMPVDKETKDDQPAIAGNYVVTDTAVTFTPQLPFKKGVGYFARYYRYDQKITNWDLILKRRKLGQAEYLELEFIAR